MRFVVMSDPHFAVPGGIPDGVWWYRTIASMGEERNRSLVRTLRAPKTGLGGELR